MTYLPILKWLCLVLFSLAMHTYSINGQTNFAPAKPFFSPISAPPLLVDLDNDSYVDLVYCSNDFYWQRNSGASSFLPSQAILTNINSKLSIIADMDNDGDLDLVFNRVTNPSVFLLSKNNGNEEFSTPESILTLDNSVNTQEVWAVDIDNDSYKDIALIQGEYWQGDLVWYKNDGIGNCSFETVLAEDIDYHPKSVLFMDTDYDGDMDFLVPQSTVIVRYENNGTGIFQSVNTDIPPALSYSVGNWDNDGHDDLIVARSWLEWNSQTNSLDYPSSITVYPSSDNGVPYQGWASPPTDSGYGPLDPYVAPGDFDGDGVRDLLFGIRSIPSTHEGYYNLVFSNENEAQTVISYVYEGESPYIAAFDIDNDGQTEILHFTRDGLLLWLDINEDSSVSSHLLFDAYPIITHFEDIDNDGYRDLVGLTRPNGNGWLELMTGDYTRQVVYIKNNEQNTNGQQIILPIYADKVYPVDFNGDNLVDILAVLSNEGRVYINEGNGNFVPTATVLNLEYSLLYVEDTDQDSDMDIVVSNGFYIDIYENNGIGDFEIMSLSVSGSLQALKDIDNDALPDLLVVYDNPKRLGWLKNYGNNSFGTFTTIADLSNDPGQVSVADMNNDSANDIVVVLNGELLWYPNNGNNTFSAGQIIGTTINNNLLIADIDQNGYKDVINYYPTIWFNQGNGEFSEMDINLAYNQVNFITDLDNDTDIDIIGGANWAENLLFHNSLQGVCFYDTNQDGQYNTGDFPLQNANIWLNPSTNYSVLGQDSYFLTPIPTNNYTISASIDGSNWQCTTDSLVYIFAAGNQVTNINFGFYPLDQVSDIAPYLTSHANNCDPIIPYYLTLYNQGTSIDSLSVLSCTLDSRFSLQSADPAPDSIGANNTVYWHSYKLLPTYRQNITLWLQNNANEGDTLSLAATATTYNHQLEMVSNHSYHYGSIIKCNTPLNDKQVAPLGVRYPNYRPH
ncbi:MAG: VCBS repeat-containing protein [Chitinophagales bacterium]|nr:VCBS repeat-containing protein [Chitinophagales bacterium]